MMRSGMTRDMAKRLREFAGWFVDPPTLSRRVTVSMTLEDMRALRLHLDRAAFMSDRYADMLAREEGQTLALAQEASEDGRVAANRKRALAAANALLEEVWADG